MKDFFALSRELAHLNSAQALIGWDYETAMPKGATAWRAETMGHFAGLIHEKSVAPDYLAAAERAHAEASDPVVKEALRQNLRDIRKKTLLPQSLVEELSRAGTLAHEAWVEARSKKDFSIFAPHLEKMLELSREQGRILGQGRDGYDALLDEYSPGMDSATIKRLFAELRPELQKILARRRPQPRSGWQVPIEVQEKIGHDLAQWMGFPAAHLLQARSVHPFCSSLHPSDVRITTRFSVTDPLMSLTSTVHELGHGLYELQLPQDYPGTAHMQANGMDLHESQSRLWEVCLALSPEFYRWVHRWFVAHAPEHIKGWSAEELYLLSSKVEPSFIRTEADPVTYGMHIMVRFQLERALFDGTLKVTDLPAAWNEAYQDYLGITPPDVSAGVLQDSHWSMGAFGYFPSYLLGTMIACQLHERLRSLFPDLSGRVERGELSGVRDWLKAHVHSFGRGKSTQDILQDATGRPLESAPFLKFLSERFTA